MNIISHLKEKNLQQEVDSITVNTLSPLQTHRMSFPSSGFALDPQFSIIDHKQQPYPVVQNSTNSSSLLRIQPNELLGPLRDHNGINNHMMKSSSPYTGSSSSSHLIAPPLSFNHNFTTTIRPSDVTLKSQITSPIMTSPLHTPQTTHSSPLANSVSSPPRSTKTPITPILINAPLPTANPQTQILPQQQAPPLPATISTMESTQSQPLFSNSGEAAFILADLESMIPSREAEKHKNGSIIPSPSSPILQKIPQNDKKIAVVPKVYSPTEKKQTTIGFPYSLASTTYAPSVTPLKMETNQQNSNWATLTTENTSKKRKANKIELTHISEAFAELCEKIDPNTTSDFDQTAKKTFSDWINKKKKENKEKSKKTNNHQTTETSETTPTFIKSSISEPSTKRQKINSISNTLTQTEKDTDNTNNTEYSPKKKKKKDKLYESMIIDEKSPLLVSTSTPVASNNCGPLIDNLEKKKLHAAIFGEDYSNEASRDSIFDDVKLKTEDSDDSSDSDSSDKTSKESSESDSNSVSNSSDEGSSKTSELGNSTSGDDEDSDVVEATEGDGDDSEEYNSQGTDIEDEIVETISQTGRSLVKRQSIATTPAVITRVLRSPRNPGSPLSAVNSPRSKRTTINSSSTPLITTINNNIHRSNNRLTSIAPTHGRGRGRRGRPPGRKTTAPRQEQALFRQLPLLQTSTQQQTPPLQSQLTSQPQETPSSIQENNSEMNDKEMKDIVSEDDKELKIEDIKTPIEESKEVVETLKEQISANTSLVIECFADGEDLGDLIDFCTAHTYSDLLVKMVEKFPHLNSVDRNKLMLYYVNYQNKKIKITESNYECTYYLRRNQLKEIHIVSKDSIK